MARIVPAGPVGRLRDVVRLRRRLRVYGADDLGGRELAVLWIAPERGYEEAAGLHVTVDGGPVPVSVYAGMEPEAAAKAIWERIEAIRRKEPGR